MKPAKANRKTGSKKNKAAAKPKGAKSKGTAKPLIDQSSLFRTLIDHLPDHIYVKDIQGHKIISNTADWQAPGGKRMEDVIGKTDFDTYPAELATRFWADDKMVLDSGKPVINREEPGRDSQDNPIWTLSTKMPLRDDNGQIVGLVGIVRDITEYKRAEEALVKEQYEMQNEMQTLMNYLPTYIYFKDRASRFTRISKSQALRFGLSDPAQAIGKTDSDFFAVEHAQQAYEDEQAIIQTGQPLIKEEKETWADRPNRWVSTIKMPMRDDEGNIIGTFGISTDITERKRAEEALRESEERYAVAVRGANDGIWDWNLKTNEFYYSPRWKSMLGYEESEIGISSDEWFKRIHPDDLMRLKAELNAHLKGDTPLFQSEHRMLHKNGQYLWVLTRGLAVRDTEGNAHRMAGSQTDISLRKQVEEQLAHDALHDALTGLPNRTLFLERLEHAMRRIKRSKDSLFAVMFLDLDRFKLINDSLGHVCGDQLLVSIAERLQRCLRPGDTVARLGGDEFAILLDDISAAADATRVADRIQKELTQPHILDGHSVSISASMGITLSSANYKQADEMLRDADIAMYRAKTMGKAQHQIFDTGMHAAVASLLELEADLRRAIQNEEFQVYYQPLISLASGAVVGTEALLRWQNPKRGLLPPSAFITILEETGMIVQVGEWVLRTACKQNKAWQDAGFPHLRVAVNFSARQFQIKNLADLIQSVLAETSMPAETLELEITESTALKDAKLTLETLNQLHALGINISLDDFGSGYSALGYLNRYPFQTLKADRSFISDIPLDSKDTAITAAIIAMAHSLKLRVVAEGVETSEQLDFLRSNSCDEVQGFLFSRPVPADELANLLQEKELLPKPYAADKPNVQPPS